MEENGNSQLITQLINLQEGIIRTLPSLVAAIVVLLIFLIISLGVKRLIIYLTRKSRRNPNLGMVMARLSRWFLILLGVLIGFVILFPNFSPTQLIELLGIGSVAIGFAFRNILQNFLAGILLLYSEHFRVGDQIIMEDKEGTVEEIQTRATLIRTYDNRRIVVPNADLFINPVTVNTAFESRRVEYEFGIGYGDDIGHAKRLVLGVLAHLDVVLKDPAPDVLVVRLDESSVTMRVRWWITPTRNTDALDTGDLVVKNIKETLYDEYGVDLPYPTRQILFHDQTEETDGDRSRQREGWPPGKERTPEASGIFRAIRDKKNEKDPSSPGKNIKPK